MKTYKKHLHICGQKLSTENITIKENLPFTQNRWLDYRMLEVKEFQRRGFYKYLVLTTRSFAAPGSLQKDIAFSQMITGWDRELKNNPTISQEGLFFVFCFLFYTVSMNCEWCAQFDKSPDPDAHRYMAYGCSNTVSLRQWVINREKRALKISCFPRSARNLNRKRWCYSSDLPRKTATFQISALSQSCC